MEVFNSTACLLVLATLFAVTHAGARSRGNGLPTGEVFTGGFCDGLNQSPIDIKTRFVVPNPTLGNIEYSGIDTELSGDVTLINTGSQAQVTGFQDEILISEGGLPAVSYRLDQFHFHTATDDRRGSEHAINGFFYPGEIHVVFYSTDYDNFTDAQNRPQGLAVLAAFLRVSREDNKALEPIVSRLCEIREENATTELPPFKIRDILPNNIQNFYRYRGSLTTPPCFQSVIWTVYKDTVPISERQLNVFRTSLTRVEEGEVVPLVNNFRDPQPLNGRLVEDNTGGGPPVICKRGYGHRGKCRKYGFCSRRYCHNENGGRDGRENGNGYENGNENGNERNENGNGRNRNRNGDGYERNGNEHERNGNGGNGNGH